jgi:predicted aconitase with swiveling domain
MIQSTVVIRGSAQGPLLQLTSDISFWGGIDPKSGLIIDQRHPQAGESVTGKILSMDRSIGSSSGSSILLELFQRGLSPAGIILLEVDFIITLGVVVAREMELGTIPVLKIRSEEVSLLPCSVIITPAGEIKTGR